MAPHENAEIFISYARKDGSEAALLLKRDLEANGLAVWLDVDRIEGGAGWTREIENAIDRCEVVLGLMTAGSFQSDICRAEQMRALRLGRCVIPVRLQPAVDVPLYFETKNWREYPSAFNHLLADIRSRRGGGLKEDYRATRVAYVTVPPMVPHYVDRPEAVRRLRQAMLSDDRPGPVTVTALEGMGGIGKTVLAQALCRDEIVQAAFPDGIVWLTIGRERKYSTVTQLRELAKALGEDVSEYENDLAAENQYRTTLRNKAALIILDDIWSAADLQPFLTESARSRFLFTTRDATIARFKDARQHRADLLDEAQSRELLGQWTERDGRELPESAAEIIHECGRVPLALATMGALLRDAGPAEWQEWLNRLKRADLADIEALLPEGQPSVFRAIDVSVRALKPEMQAHYNALAVLPEDMQAALPVLCCLWNVDIAKARLVAEHLGNRSLAEWDPSLQRLRLHDLQLDYVRAQHADREALDLMIAAVRLSADVIGEDPGQFAPQIVGRLLPYRDVAAVARFAERIADGSPGPWLEPLQPALHPPGTHLLRTLRSPSSDSYAVSVMPDGRRAISGHGDGTLRIWDLETGRTVSTLGGGFSRVNAVAVTPDARRAVSASSDNVLRVWDLETSRLVCTLEGHSGNVTDVAVMPDGRRAISASDDATLRVWDLDARQGVSTLEEHSAVTGVAVISDRQVVSASARTLKVWDLEERRVVRALEDSSAVTGVAVTPDGRRAIAASATLMPCAPWR